MNYAKPEVVLSGSALGTIQAQSKGNFVIPDVPFQPTNAAYEADE